MPKGRKKKKKMCIPTVTSSPVSDTLQAETGDTSQAETSDTSQAEIDEAKRQFLAYIDSRCDEIKRKYEEEMIKMKMQFADFLDTPFTINLLPDEVMGSLDIRRRPPSQADVVDGCDVAQALMSQPSTPQTSMARDPQAQAGGRMDKGKVKKGKKKVHFEKQDVDSSGFKRWLLRRPMSGEVAVSMSGSPLLVASYPVESDVQLLLKTVDGKTLVVLPSEDSYSQEMIPELSEQAKEELFQIRNLISNIVSINGN